jgi:hypothetical protein
MGPVAGPFQACSPADVRGELGHRRALGEPAQPIDLLAGRWWAIESRWPLRPCQGEHHRGGQQDAGKRPYRPIRTNDRPVIPIDQVSEASKQAILRVAAENPGQGPKWILHKLRQSRHDDITEDEVRSVLHHRLGAGNTPRSLGAELAHRITPQAG